MYRNRFLEGYGQFSDPVGTVNDILGDAYSYQPIIGLTGTGRPWYGGNDEVAEEDPTDPNEYPTTIGIGSGEEDQSDSVNTSFGLTPGENATVAPENIGKFAVDSFRYGMLMPTPLSVPMIGLSFATNILGARLANLMNPELSVFPVHDIQSVPVAQGTFGFGRAPSFTGTQAFGDLAADLGVDLAGISAGGGDIGVGGLGGGFGSPGESGDGIGGFGGGLGADGTDGGAPV